MDLLVNYIKSIMIPFLSVWTLIFNIPETIYPLSLFCQFFSFIYVRDALIPAGLWTIHTTDGRFEMKFIEDTSTLFLLSWICLFNVWLTHFANKGVLPLTIINKSITPLSAVGIGFLFSLAIYYPVYVYRQIMPTVLLANIQRNFPLTIANLFMCLCGNMMEETLYRGYLARYLKSYGISMIRSVFIQGALFAVLHMYLAFTVTNAGVVVLFFTLYEGLLCAYAEYRYGVVTSTVAHGLAIFYFCMFSYRF
jgi:uncharacterized protein